MSISSMASHAVARKFPTSHEAQVVQVRAQTVNAQGEKEPQDKFTQALEMVMAYIPTEILTLYVATIAALQQGASSSEKEGAAAAGAAAAGAAAAGGDAAAGGPLDPQLIAFLVYLAATPIFVWLIYAAKFKAREAKLPWKPSEWPAWEMISAVIAYVAWAYALPNTPLKDVMWYSPSLAGIGVMVTAAVLGLVTPLVHPEKKSS